MPELESFESLFQSAPVAITLISADRRVLWLNKRAQTLIGYSAEECIGADLQHLHQDPLVLDDIMARLLAKEELSDYPFRLKTKSGAIEYVYLSSNGYFEDGELVHTRCFVRPVENRAHVEYIINQRIELRRSLVELQQSSARFEKLAEVAPVVIFRSDADGRIIYFNQKWGELTGIPVEEGYGQGWVNAIHPEDREWLVQEWGEAVEKGAPYKCGFRFLRADGVVVWMLADTTVEGDTAGRVIGHLGTLTDISQIKEMELEVHQHQWQAAHMSRVGLADEMASGIAHEINQPLTAIIQRIGGCLLLADQYKLPEKMHDALTEIEKKAHRAGQVIHHLKRFVKKEEMVMQCN